jgi:hypothetical protein
MPFDVSDRILSRAEVWGLATIYFPLAEREHAVDVCFLESGFHTGVHNASGEDSRGLWQVNVAEASYPALAKYNLYDPMLNAFWAAYIFKGRGWSPWHNSAIKLGLPT